MMDATKGFGVIVPTMIMIVRQFLLLLFLFLF